MKHWKTVVWLLLVLALGWLNLSQLQAGYRTQVQYMLEYCRAEAQLYLYAEGNDSQVSCSLEVWDGGKADFDVLGSNGLRYSCYADEAGSFPEKMERCRFLGLSAPSAKIPS